MDKKERKRLSSLMALECAARQRGYHRIVGVDEAGRGPLAGPVVAAACLLPETAQFEGIDDSKKLSAKERKCLFDQIISCPGVDYGIGIMDVHIIDSVNVLQATFLAMVAAVHQLSSIPDFVLVDGPHLPPQLEIEAQAVVKGDGLSQSIAAASIIAKHTRDQLMEYAHEQWPLYGFAQHKGYPTKAHYVALTLHGPCPIHRKTFMRKLYG